MKVHGDEEWVRDHMEPDDGYHLEKTEDAINRVLVSHDGLVQLYYLVFANDPDSDIDQRVVSTGPSSELDNIMPRKEDAVPA